MTVAELMLLGRVPNKKLWQLKHTTIFEHILQRCLAQVGLTGKQYQLITIYPVAELQRAQLGRVLMQKARSRRCWMNLPTIFRSSFNISCCTLSAL